MRNALYIGLVCVLFFGTTSAQTTHYLIVTHEDFKNAIQPLAEWKHKKGVPTNVVSVPSEIREIIYKEWKNSGEELEYVLLVGDLSRIPVGQDYPPCRSDNYYANMKGYFKAELSVGRFPCTNAIECSTMVSKTFAYERTPFLDDTLWFKWSTIVIRFDHEGDTTGYYVGDFYYIRDTCMVPMGFIVDSLFYREGYGWHNQEPDSARQVIEDLNEGRSYLVYRGHSEGDWYEPFGGIPDSFSLNNGAKLPLVFAGTCTTLLYNTTVGEKWLRIGTPQNLRGALAYIGNSTTGSSI